MEREESKKTNLGKGLAYIALFCALTVVCSWISVPTPVPFTLSTFALFLAVCVLGARDALFVALAYVALGLVGVPVFAGFQAGFSALFNGTGGYILGYIIGGGVMWLMELLPVKKGKKIIALTAGLLTYYLCGTLWYALVFVQGAVGITAALLTCVLPFILPDVAKIIVAVIIGKKINQRRGK